MVPGQRRLSMREGEQIPAPYEACVAEGFSRPGHEREEDQPAVSEHRQRVTGEHGSWGRAHLEAIKTFRWSDK